MSRSLNAQLISLPAPTLGMDTASPLAAMPIEKATWISNADCEDRKIKARGGYVQHCSFPGGTVIGMGVYGYEQNGKLLAHVQTPTAFPSNNVIYNISTSTPSVEISSLPPGPDESVFLNAKSQLYVLTETNLVNNQRYDGTSWSNWGITYTGSPFQALCGCYYKGRVFLATPYDGTGAPFGNIMYGDPAQVTGGFNGTNAPFSIGDIYTYNIGTSIITTFAQTDGVINEQYIAFMNKAGEVLVYSGDSPASTNWALASRFLIGRPVGYQSVINFQNDALLITFDGLISLRTLFTLGEKAAIEQAVSRDIADLWKDLFYNYPNPNSAVPFRQPKGIYSNKEKRIYIVVPGYVDSSGAYTTDFSTMLSYNASNGAWSTHKLNIYSDDNYGAANICYFNGDIYFAIRDQVFKLDPTQLHDDIVTFNGSTYTTTPGGYTVEIHGPHLKLSQGIQTTKVEGGIVIAKSDSDAQPPGIAINADFGARESQYTYPNDPSGGTVRPFASVGATGTYFQIKFKQEINDSSNPDIDTLTEFYAYNILSQPGGMLS